MKHLEEQRQILCDDIDTVCSRPLRLPSIVAGTRGGTSKVDHPRLGLIEVNTAINVGTVAQIQVLKVRKMLFVKQSNLF